jgi:hypothetical protein
LMSSSDISMSEIGITGSDSDSSVDIQAQQWVEVRNSGLPHSIEHQSRARGNLR